MVTDKEQMYNHIATTLWGYMKVNKYGVEKMAHMASMGVQTLYTRLARPETFRLRELIELADWMGITVEELIGKQQ